MPDDQPRHPLERDPQQPPQRKPHPLSDPLPEEPESRQQNPQRRNVRVTFPGTVKVPYVTYALIAVNVLIFLLRYIDLRFASEMFGWGLASVDTVLVDRELYRLFTAMFLHLNEAHILFNGIALYYIGSNVEHIFGHARFALVYLLGGLAGSVFMLFFGTGGVGASGAVFAIWGAEAVFFYEHRQLFGAIATARLRNSMMMMLMNFLIGFFVNTAGAVTDSPVRISNAAHFGGLIGGALLTWLVGPRFVPVPRAVSNPDELPFKIEQQNPLAGRIREILFYASGLAVLLLLAIMLRT